MKPDAGEDDNRKGHKASDHRRHIEAQPHLRLDNQDRRRLQTAH